MDNRNNYFSTTKALGIILMVIGHSGCPEYLHRLIYYFHMPLFFFISGFFFDINGGGKSFVTRRLRSQYLPYIKWSITFLFLHNFFFNIGIYNTEYGYNGHVFYTYDTYEFLKRFFLIVFTMDKHEPILGGFWFLKTLFLSSIFVKLLTAIVGYISPRKNNLFSMTICVFFLLISKYFKIDIPLLGDLSLIFGGSVFYLFGYLYHDIENKGLYRWYWLFFGGVSMIIFAYYFHSISMACEFNDVIIYIVIALIGIYCSLGLCYYLEKSGFGLYYIGKNTMQILALHFLSFKVISICVILYYSLSLKRLSEFPVIQYHNDLIWLVYSLVGVLLPIFIKKGYDKVLLIYRAI